MKRRSFLQFTATALGTAPFLSGAVHSESATSARYGLEGIGRITPAASLDIKASPLSVGFEVLDRKGFDPEKTYGHLARLGVKWARCQTGWCRCETEHGKYDFSWLDEVVDSLIPIGIQPWFNLGYGNRLYTPGASDEAAVGWAPVLDDEAMNGWLRFTRAIAEHFRGRVSAWEIWNEPNITHFWKPEKPDAGKYVELTARTAPLIREVIPDAMIIGGAFAGIPMPYIQDCFSAGLLDHIDAISLHPYRPQPEKGCAEEIARVRAMIGEQKKDIPIWQGENGCPSAGGPESTGALSNLDWNEDLQARWLLRRILTDLHLELPLTSYFHTVDLVGYRGKTNFKGLLRGTDYSPKLAYFAYQNLCALFDSRTAAAALLSERLDGDKGALQEAAFTRDGVPIFAYWIPADLMKPWQMESISLRLPWAIKDPVLADPLTGDICAIPETESSDTHLVARNLPLMNYPLLLTGRRAVL